MWRVAGGDGLLDGRFNCHNFLTCISQDRWSQSFVVHEFVVKRRLFPIEAQGGNGFVFIFSIEEMPSAGDAGVFWAAHKRHLAYFGGDVLCYIVA